MSHFELGTTPDALASTHVKLASLALLAVFACGTGAYLIQACPRRRLFVLTAMA